MSSCLVLGDSHAVATADALRAALGNRCAVVAQSRIPSSTILDRTPVDPYQDAVISAGANDADNPRLADNLNAIRYRLRSARVVWLLPYDRRASSVIEDVAKRWGDLVIDLAWARSRPDRIHCQSYRWVARSIARAGYVGPVGASLGASARFSG